MKAAVYQESGGRAVVEAENFHERVHAPNGKHWHVWPNEDLAFQPPHNGDFADMIDNPRGGFAGKYLQMLPNNGQIRTLPSQIGFPPYVDYKVNITTPGDYRIWLRWAGPSGSDDSVYAQIVGISDGLAGTIPDWHRYNRGTPFGWQDSNAGFEQTSAGGKSLALPGCQKAQHDP